MLKSHAVQLLLRVIAISFLSIFVYRIYELSLSQDLTLNLWLLLIGEIITIGIVAFARFAKDIGINLISIISTVVASFYFLIIQLDPVGDGLLPEYITSSIQLFAICFQIYAKLCLGFSFGLLPANRGIITHGAYRIVRHPIYLGYFLNHIGFLLYAFSIWNVIVFAILYFFQGIRIWQEEKVLRKDEQYQAYMNKTKYRFIPYVF